MNYLNLLDELTTDPLVRGYSTMSDVEASDDLNTVYRTKDKGSISGSEAFALTDSVEYLALTDTRKSQWLSLCGVINHDPFGTSVQVAVDIFGGGSTTIANLNAYRTDDVSRGVELNFGYVGPGDVAAARALGA